MYLVGNGARKLSRKIFLRGTRQRARAALYIYVTVYVILKVFYVSILALLSLLLMQHLEHFVHDI